METETTERGSSAFTATHWSIVLEAQQTDPQRAGAALESLCSRYWYPLYAFIRRRGHDPEEAKDLTQSFFVHLLSKHALDRVDRSKGLFRTFLLTALVNFLNDERDRQRAAKRGGGVRPVSWDELKAEEMYRHEPADCLAPEKLFDRRWAFTLIEQALLRLRRENEACGKQALFQQLEPCLTGEVSPGFYDQAAAQLAMHAGAVRVARHRLCRRLGEILRSEVAETVTRPEEVEGELRYLLGVLGQ